MLPLTKGHYIARMAATPQDVDRALALRHLCFISNRGLVTPTTDVDAFDNASQHILVADIQSGTLVCTFRLMLFTTGADILTSYSAQTYDLTRLATYPGPMAELGRFCIHPDHSNPDILRVAWAALTCIVDTAGTQILFGCTSFEGADPAQHRDAMALLKAGNLAPEKWRPGAKSAQTYPFADALRAVQPDPKRGLITMPPLLRTYLAMGGWVSDHAVIDNELNTLHVFTGLEIAAIPPARARALRAIAAAT